MIDPLFSGAVVTGFLGSGHCAGMCGALVGALGLARMGAVSQALYQVGRICAYVLLGFGVGWLGLAAAHSGGARGVGRALLIIGDLLVILLGLGTAASFGRLDALGLRLPGAAGVLAATVRALRRLPPALSALPLGFSLGFIPCGFLYSVLLTAALTADPSDGARVMLGFGLGTVPALAIFGGVAGLVGARARGWMGRAAGLAVAAMGAFHLARHVLLPPCCL